MPATTPMNERLVDAAFDLFDARGFDQTTVEDITAHAGVGRTTFFRHYRSKEDVIFPDHNRLLGKVEERLATSTASSPLVAVCEAVRIVLIHYVDEGERARRRYALTSTVPALRDREIASVARYQRLFREFLTARIGGAAEDALRAELMAASVVSAHNHVLRRWLRDEVKEPLARLDHAMADVVALFASQPVAGDGATIVVLQDARDPDQVASVIRRALRTGGPAEA